MKTLLKFALFASVLFLSRGEAEEVGAKHWYQITISTGSQTQTFTGSSELEGDSMEAHIQSANEIITLRELRENGNYSGTGNTWIARTDVLWIKIPVKGILYFAELAKDPLRAQEDHK